MADTLFNSKYGFDLGNISNLEITGASSTTDQVLILKSIGGGKYKLEPQSLSAVGTTNSVTITPTTGSSYYKKEVFANSMSSTTSFTSLKNFSFNIGTTKTKLYLTINLDLIGQGTVGGTFHYYHFTTGYNIVSDTTGAGVFIHRHIPGRFSYIFNKGSGINNSIVKAVGPDKQFQLFSALPTVPELKLQPKFSTLTDPLNTANYPKIIHSINTGNTNSTTDDTLDLTIQGKSIRSDETIEWFGTVEFFASIA